MSLQEVQTLTGGQLSGADASFNGVSIDSRTLKAGELFIAISGENFNGNKFVSAAAEKHAAAAITTEKVDTELSTLPS